MYLAGIALAVLIRAMFGYGERLGWDFPKRAAIAFLVGTLAMLPLILLAKLLERAIT